MITRRSLFALISAAVAYVTTLASSGALGMTEMIERVARALATHQFGSPESWEDQIPMARAAIEAMREPTDAMIVSAYKDPSFVPDLSPTGTWQAMIDEALKCPEISVP